MLRPTSFAARLGVATSAVIVFVCLFQAWILGQRDLEHVRAYLTDRGRMISTSIAHEAAASLVAADIEGLHRLAEQARAQSDVASCRFLDRHGLLLVATGKPGAGAAPLQATAAGAPIGPIAVGDDRWEFQAPIFGTVLPPERVGTVAIGISLVSLDALRRQTFATATLLTFVFLLFAVMSAVALARAITRPLRALATAADAIARGELATRVEAGTDDEIASVARAFNAMAESLATNRAVLEAKIDELERANHLKSEFLATVSHELRTPLNVIMGYAEVLADPVSGELNAGQSTMVAAIRQYSELQLHLVTNVLDFSRLASGHVTYKVERFDLATLLTEVAALHQTRLRDSTVSLTIAADPNLPVLETDRVKLHEVLHNLLENAVKFTASGHVTLAARAGSSPGSVTIEVSDTGSGIDPADLPHVFDAFYQGGDSKTRATGGVGLGLSLVKTLVGALGGTVSVVSQPGDGSTFCVEIPCRLTVDPGVAAVEGRGEAPTMQPKRTSMVLAGASGAGGSAAPGQDKGVVEGPQARRSLRVARLATRRADGG